MTFRIFWGFNAVIAAIALFFFVVGLSNGRVSSFNIGMWLALLLGLAGILGGSLWLRSRGHHRPAMGLLLILAIPGLLCLLFFLAVMILHPRWN